MTTTKLSLYNGALRLIGERALASLTENREPRRVLDSVWDEGAVDYALGQTDWSFALRSSQIEYDIGIEPDFGYQRAFAKPDDFIRLAAISANEYFTPPLTEFVEEAGYWYAGCDDLFVQYVSNDSEYGGDYGLWTPGFVKYITAYLAFEAAPRITNSQASVDKLEARMLRALKDAKGQNGVQRPTRFLPQGRWSSARRGPSFLRGDEPIRFES